VSLSGAASGETTRVIWALGSRSPSADGGGLADLVAHSADARGVRSLLLQAPGDKPRRDEDAAVWDLRHEAFQLPAGMDTVYWCRVFAAPESSTKTHIIGYEPILTPGSERHVHHMLLYWCAADALTAPGKSINIFLNTEKTKHPFLFWLFFKIDLWSATSMESSRRDLSNDMAELRPILKNNQNKY